MTHVLNNLARGGRGKKDLAPRWAGMTIFKRDDITTTTTTRDIARAATTYYSALFAPTATIDDNKDSVYGCTLPELLDTAFDLWEHDAAITADMLFNATCTCPKNDDGTRQASNRNVGDRHDDTPRCRSSWTMNEDFMNYTTTTRHMTTPWTNDEGRMRAVTDREEAP